MKLNVEEVIILYSKNHYDNSVWDLLWSQMLFADEVKKKPLHINEPLISNVECVKYVVE